MFNFLKNKYEIIDCLYNEKIILMQTDTIFGLLCRGDNIDCIKRIEEIKHRDHPAFGFFVRNLMVAEKYVKLNDMQKKYFNTAFPGYFTLIFEAKDEVVIDDISAMKIENKNCCRLPQRCFGRNKNNKLTLGIRVPNNNMCLDILEKVNFPVLATSANISKQPSPTTFESIDRQILEKVDAIYYNESVKIANLNSTILDLSCGKPVILRQGSGDTKIFDDFC